MTDHVPRQYLGSVGKTENGIVAVTSLWAMNGITIHCISSPIRRLHAWFRASEMRHSAPNRASPWSWSKRPRRRASNGRQLFWTAGMGRTRNLKWPYASTCSRMRGPGTIMPQVAGRSPMRLSRSGRQDTTCREALGTRSSGASTTVMSKSDGPLNWPWRAMHLGNRI